MPCQIDTNYKRVSKRLYVVLQSPASYFTRCLIFCPRKINELAEEVKRLRYAVDGRSSDIPSSSIQNGATTSFPSHVQQLLSLQPQPPLFQPPCSASTEKEASPAGLVSSVSATVSGSSLATYSRSLEHITLDKDRIIGLFQVSVNPHSHA